MKKNKHIDLFNDMIPAVNQGICELWDAAGVDGQKEIKSDLWILNRYISAVRSNNPEIQEHYVLTVNEFYNKNWATIDKHPKLQWQTLCTTSHESKKDFSREWIPLKKINNKKTEFLLNLFPNMKLSDAETLAAISSDKEIKQYCVDSGWDKKQVNAIKF
jgi:hypothetical protein